MQRQVKDADPARWESGTKLKLSKVKLLCRQCGVVRGVKDFKPLSRVAVLGECGHERKV